MENELLTEQEIHEKGLMIVIQWLQQHGFDIEFAQPGKHELPNILARSGEIYTYILVGVDMYPNKGTIAEADKAAMLEHTQANGGLAACAHVGLANAYAVEAGEKHRIGRAEKNARFVADFGGLQYIQFEN